MPHDVSARFAAGGLIGVAVDWLHRGCPQTPTEIAILTLPLIAPLSGQRRARRHEAGADVDVSDACAADCQALLTVTSAHHFNDLGKAVRLYPRGGTSRAPAQ
jgi:hypothetical protein